MIHPNSLRHNDIKFNEVKNIQPQEDQLLQKDFSSGMFEDRKSGLGMFDTDSKYFLVEIVCTEEIQLGGKDSEIEAEQEAIQSYSNITSRKDLLLIYHQVKLKLLRRKPILTKMKLLRK